METSLFIFVVGVFVASGWTKGTALPDLTKNSSSMLKSHDSQIQELRAILSMENHAIEFEDNLKCMDKMLCVLAAQPGPKSCLQPKTPLDLFVNIATCTEQGADSQSYRQVKDLISCYPRFKDLLTSSSIGDVMKDESVCTAIYPACPLKSVELLAMVNDLGKVTNLSADNPLKQVFAEIVTADGYPVERNSRSKRRCAPHSKEGVCGAAGGACGVSGIACLICGIFTFGICAGGCGPAVGVVCGVGTATCSTVSAAC